MSEQKAANAQGQFAIQKVYLKDVSFESPASPEIFTKKWEPEVNMEINTSSKTIAEDVIEVVLRLTITVKLGEQIAYLTEIQQAGIFTIKGLTEAEKSRVTATACPNILFPFGREAVADVVSKGGFPQLLLAPVNFEAIYAQHQAQQAKAKKEQGQTPSEAVH